MKGRIKIFTRGFLFRFGDKLKNFGENHRRPWGITGWIMRMGISIRDYAWKM